jgi:uncharacterized protein GlcG (DUF336 family)
LNDTHRLTVAHNQLAFARPVRRKIRFSVKRFFQIWILTLLLPLSLRAQMTVTDVETVVAQAVTRAAAISSGSIVAVVDREGYVLGVWSVDGLSPATAAFTNRVANAISKAAAGAFLSSNNHAFTSRTAAMIVQQNFPPGVNNRPPGPLVGVNFSNLAFSDVNRIKDPSTFSVLLGASGINGAAAPIPVSGGLGGTPGGVPLYKGGVLIGGVGVDGDGDGPLDITPEIILQPDVDEDVALAGQIGFEPSPAILGTHIFIDGIRLPYVASSTELGSVSALGTIGAAFPGFPPVGSPFTLNGISYPAATMGGLTGELRQPILADPSAAPLPGGVARLTAAEVTAIIEAAANRVRTTRAGIRLPRGNQMQAFISVVNNPNVAGAPPVVLGTFGTSPDATRFSWDVAVQKARTCVFFSNDTRAFSTRAIGFMAQSLFPPGIEGTQPGVFRGLQERYSIITATPVSLTNPLNGATITTETAVNPNLPNGITIFPGGVPLYRDGVLIGAIGVSGDGIDQDDIVAASGATLFPPPEAIRADRSIHRGVRLPFVKFPRNPAL